MKGSIILVLTFFKGAKEEEVHSDTDLTTTPFSADFYLSISSKHKNSHLLTHTWPCILEIFYFPASIAPSRSFFTDESLSVCLYVCLFAFLPSSSPSRGSVGIMCLCIKRSFVFVTALFIHSSFWLAGWQLKWHWTRQAKPFKKNFYSQHFNFFLSSYQLDRKKLMKKIDHETEENKFARTRKSKRSSIWKK